MSKILAIDVDLVVVDTLNPWLDWFEENYEVIVDFTNNNDYDLVPRMVEAVRKAGLYRIKYDDVFDFWRASNLYDRLKPVEGAVDFVRRASENNNVIFVSHCVPEHENSKRRFLQRHFEGYYDGFISTSDKHFVGYDLIVDDSQNNINKCNIANPTKDHVLFSKVSKSVYGPNSDYMKDSRRVDDFEDIYERYIKN